MTRNHCYKTVIYLIFWFSVLALGVCGVLEPNEIEFREELQLKDKYREYFLVYKNPLHYEIEGPQRIEIISRRAIPKTSTRKYDYGYQFKLNNQSVTINHSKRKYDEVTSKDHPGHGYTYSGNCIVTIPSGNHVLTISPIKKGKPVLVRVLEKLYPKLEGIVQHLHPVENENSIVLKIGEKSRQYSILSVENPINIVIEKPGIIAVYGRYGFDTESVEFANYQIQIIENGIPGNILVEIADRNNFNKSKSRIGQFEIMEGKQNISFQLINGTVPVYLRIMEYVVYE